MNRLEFIDTEIQNIMPVNKEQIYYHYSGQKFVFYDRFEYDKDKSRGYKPVGLWITDDSEYNWKQWCESEEFNTEDLKYCSKIKVNLSDNVLVLSTVYEILHFDRKYKVLKLNNSLCSIDWNKVREHYKGIIISPYQWDLRLDPKVFWYYGWDCSSGCIWDLSCITNVE